VQNELPAQLMPAGVLTTVPPPVPAVVTLNVLVCNVKVAVTVTASVGVNVHEDAVPVQAPDQPSKVELVPPGSDALRVTGWPGENDALHLVLDGPQFSAPVASKTVPSVADPASTSWIDGVVVNVAVSVLAPVTGIVHVPVPEHGEDQPVKVEPLAGVAVRTTLVPVG
jgi:hypothetical protein